MIGLVVDASVAASWLFPDEAAAAADRALAAVGEAPGLVPLLWHYEMRNILLVAERRGRISREGLVERVSALSDLPLETDADADLGRALTLAETHRLSFYDALYLELAQRRGARLASLDARLVEAARAAGVAVEGDLS